jgi:hypothetical protein
VGKGRENIRRQARLIHFRNGSFAPLRARECDVRCRFNWGKRPPHRADPTTRAQCRTPSERHQKSGATACGMGSADVPGKKEFGLSAQISSVSGPSGALANCAMRAIPT